MAIHVSEHGFEFAYPDAWDVVEEADAVRIVVTVSPDDTTFWSITLLRDRTTPSAALDAVVAALEEEFGDVEVHSSNGKLAGLKAETRTIEFVCWDLTNTAIASATRHRDGTLLVLSQFTDSEQAEVEQELRRITQSLSLAGKNSP